MIVAIQKSLLLCLIHVLYILPIVGFTQPVNSTQPAQHITSVPFSMLTGGIVIIRAAIDSMPDSLNFILDTGSGGISLDSATCSDLKLNVQSSERVIRGIAGIRTVNFTYDHTLQLPQLAVEHLDFHINDYDILSSVYGVKIDGIIGYSFFRRYVVRVNYDKMQMEVLTPGTISYPRGGTLLKPLFSTLAMQDLDIEDRIEVNARFYFDMGAGLCLLLSKAFADDTKVLKEKKKMFETQAQGLGGKALMSVTVIKRLKVGPYRFRKVPTYIFDDEYNATSYPATGGLIGNDILRRFNVVLNYGKQEIHIKPNSHFRDSFDYAYTGLGIYMIENEVMVLDIVEGSPAEKAGFKEGDVILGMNKQIGVGIQVYKTLLQSPNTLLFILVRNKAGALETRQLKVKSIM